MCCLSLSVCVYAHADTPRLKKHTEASGTHFNVKLFLLAAPDRSTREPTSLLALEPPSIPPSLPTQLSPLSPSLPSSILLSCFSPSAPRAPNPLRAQTRCLANPLLPLYHGATSRLHGTIQHIQHGTCTCIARRLHLQARRSSLALFTQPTRIGLHWVRHTAPLAPWRCNAAAPKGCYYKPWGNVLVTQYSNCCSESL